MMYQEFGPETHQLTTADVKVVWKHYLQPPKLRAQEGSSSTHHPDLAGPTAAGGSNEESHSAHGQQYLAIRSNPDNIHRPPIPKFHSAIAKGQASRHEQPEADHSGTNGSHEAPRYGNGVRRLGPPLTDDTLPSDRLTNLLSLSRNTNRPDLHTMPTPAGREQGLPPSRSAPSAPSILAPSYVGAGVPNGLAHDQPHQWPPRLGQLIPQEGMLDREGHHDLLDWWDRGFSREATMRWRSYRRPVPVLVKGQYQQLPTSIPRYLDGVFGSR